MDAILKGRHAAPFVYLPSRDREDPTIAYRIDKDDHDVLDALRRIATEQIDGALASVEDEGDIGARVHDIRKRMKKLRGLIRLVRPVFPDYETENRHFRDTARSLSAARDAQVTAATLDRLLEEHGEAIDAEAYAGLRAELAADRPEAPDLDPVAEALRLAQSRVDVWTLHETGWDAVAGGLGKTYRRARKCRRAKGDDALHDWRKRIKYHWYHVRLLREIWPDGMDAREQTADAMGDCLGLRQDLAVLDSRVQGSDLTKASRRVLRGLIAQRKSELEAGSRELAPRLLTDKTKVLTAHWGELWETWRA